MSELINVGVADMKVSGNSSVLASFGLGSCVAVIMFDPVKKIGGLAHVMLPESRNRDSDGAPGKFADTAVGRLVDEMVKHGARPGGIRCKIAGGSQMFDMSGVYGGAGGEPASHIGRRNVEAVKRELARLRIPLQGEDTGGNHGRTVKFDVSTGDVDISSIHYSHKKI